MFRQVFNSIVKRTLLNPIMTSLGAYARLLKKIKFEEGVQQISIEEAVKKFNDENISEEGRDKYYRLNFYSEIKRDLEKILDE